MKNYIHKKALFFGFFGLMFFIKCAEPTEEFVYANIETTFGNMKVKLYNQTKEHKQNFIALAEKGFYDDLLFHRVINNFMIQGGDPNSKNAPLQLELGSGGTTYKIPAEIFPEFINKKGALVAARQPNEINPKKMSSGCQFYLITGKKYSDAELDKVEKKKNRTKKQKRVENLLHSNMMMLKILDSLQTHEMQKQIDSIYEKAEKQIDKEYENEAKFKISAEHRKIYTTLGGVPYLDGDFTVFGEIVEGFDVLDKISKQKTNEKERPLKNIKMKITILK